VSGGWGTARSGEVTLSPPAAAASAKGPVATAVEQVKVDVKANLEEKFGAFAEKWENEVADNMASKKDVTDCLGSMKELIAENKQREIQRTAEREKESKQNKENWDLMHRQRLEDQKLAQKQWETLESQRMEDKKEVLEQNMALSQKVDTTHTTIKDVNKQHAAFVETVTAQQAALADQIEKMDQNGKQMTNDFANKIKDLERKQGIRKRTTPEGGKPPPGSAEAMNDDEDAAL
jgi:hypothetical protein